VSSARLLWAQSRVRHAAEVAVKFVLVDGMVEAHCRCGDGRVGSWLEGGLS
jgi:hypothetical protein